MNNRVPGIAYIRNSMYNRPDTKEIAMNKPEHKDGFKMGVEAATPPIPITERKVMDPVLSTELSDRSGIKFFPKNIIILVVVVIIILFLFKEDHY